MYYLCVMGVDAASVSTSVLNVWYFFVHNLVVTFDIFYVLPNLNIFSILN